MSGRATEGIRPGRLLLVDDEPAVRRSLARLLERAGFTVDTAGSMAEAYERLEQATPAFAVVDLNLSDGYGMELVSGLIETCPGIRVVVLTGYDSIASSVVAIKAGAWGYLAKPADADQLVATLLGEQPTPLAQDDRPMSADRIRWEYIQRVFEQCGRNVSETARRLHMHRRTLQRILSKRAPRP
ncbi:Photosynthetic apparatus regulatory protein RegA [bacterium HR40]|nr:Photosynthetic apparatus regulatory protein RegA [bacterium HR40]